QFSAFKFSKGNRSHRYTCSNRGSSVMNMFAHSRSVGAAETHTYPGTELNPGDNQNQRDLNMHRATEILFVDQSVPYLDTVLSNLRPEVHAIVLDARSPAVSQIAAALEGRQGLDAVHVMAH